MRKLCTKPATEYVLSKLQGLSLRDSGTVILASDFKSRVCFTLNTFFDALHFFRKEKSFEWFWLLFQSKPQQEDCHTISQNFWLLVMAAW